MVVAEIQNINSLNLLVQKVLFAYEDLTKFSARNRKVTIKQSELLNLQEDLDQKCFTCTRQPNQIGLKLITATISHTVKFNLLGIGDSFLIGLGQSLLYGCKHNFILLFNHL